jgi:CubicO group peptidase (beta-lactamase class C family)
MVRGWAYAMAWLSLFSHAPAPEKIIGQNIDAYLKPYVESGNFSGTVLVKKEDKIIFQKAHGFADRENHVANTTATRFHLASVSMQFTAAAVLRLVDQGSLSLDTHVGEFVPGIAGADKITVRDLLAERSGLPDINSFPDYNEILQQHQTPDSLVAKIEGHPLLFEPGTKFLHEEHSAYNLLALILEKKTGLPFPSAVERLVFRPAGLKSSGEDDDATTGASGMAIGYEPEGVNGTKRAETIHWSAKSGNASAYSTAADEARLVEAFVTGNLVTSALRDAALDPAQNTGYGWFKGADKRFDEIAYHMTGRSPGFGSFVLYLPREQVTVVVLGNLYSSATVTIGYDVAAIALGLPYVSFQPGSSLDAKELENSTGKFQFGADFYQANAQVSLIENGGELALRWPSGSLSPLIPMTRDHFMDRSYWEPVTIERDSSGRPSGMVYDKFHGSAVRAE